MKRRPGMPCKVTETIKRVSACFHTGTHHYNLVSRILFLSYHLSSLFIAKKVLLPTLDCFSLQRIGRAALRQSYTWHYSTQGLPFPQVTRGKRELLPHIFTLTPKGGYFLWHSLSTGGWRRCCPAVHRWVALRCPDFPPLNSYLLKSDNSGL